MPSSNNTVAPATSPPPPIDPSQVQWDAPAAPTAAPTAAAGSTAAAGPIDPSQVQWDQPSIGRAAALFGGGIAEGAASLPIAAAQLAGNAQLGSDVTGSGEDTADAIINQNTPRPAAPTDNTVSALPAWMQYLDPNKIAGLLHKGLVSLGMPAAPASTGEQAAYNAGQGIGRVATAALAPETLPGALISSEAGEAAKTGVQAAGGGQGAQSLADIGGSLAISLPTAFAAAARGLVRGGSQGAATMAANLASAADNNVPLTVGQASGNRGVQALESASSKLWGGSAFAHTAEEQTKALGTGVSKIVENLTPDETSPTIAGQAINSGVAQTRTAMGQAEDAAYQRVEQAIPPGSKIPVQNATNTLSSLTTPIPGAEATTGSLVSPKLQVISQGLQQDTAANGGTMPYSAVRALRTKIGSMIDWGFSPADPVTNGGYKQLYGALSRDLSDGAATISPEAQQAAQSANALYAANSTQRDALNNVVDKAGGPEAVYNAAFSGVKNGATRISQVMSALGPADQNIVRATFLNRLGRPSGYLQNAQGDVFNPSTFLTGWANLSGDAKNAIFGASGPSNQLRGGLDSLTQTMSALRASQALKNPSGTAGAVGHSLGLAALLFEGAHTLLSGGTSLAASVGGVLSNAALSRALTNPWVVRQLAQASKAPMGRLLGTAAAANSATQTQ